MISSNSDRHAKRREHSRSGMFGNFSVAAHETEQKDPQTKTEAVKPASTAQNTQTYVQLKLF